MIKAPWLLVYVPNHFVLVAWAIAFSGTSFIMMSCQMQLRWVAMQATGHLLFTSMLSSGCLHGRLCTCFLL